MEMDLKKMISDTIESIIMKIIQSKGEYKPKETDPDFIFHGLITIRYHDLLLEGGVPKDTPINEFYTTDQIAKFLIKAGNDIRDLLIEGMKKPNTKMH